jgi:hypothetical protein
MSASTFALKSGGILVLAAGVTWNVCMSVSDLFAARNQPQFLRQAIRLMPLNPGYRVQLANELFVMDPDAAQAALEKAIQLDPYKAPAWIQLGILYEGENNVPKAEHAFLQAAKVDKTFLSAWSLANFYFRHNSTDQFWLWAGKAAQMSPADALPLFRLAWYMEPDVNEIESRLQMQRPFMKVQFLNFLMDQQEADAVAQAATRLLTSDKGKNDTLPALTSACEWLIEHRRPELALPLWNELAKGGLIPYHALIPGSANAITNATFSRQPSSSGFDWRVGNPTGISAFFNTNPNALGFEFSGDEAETALLMWQVVPVLPGKTYKLMVDYATKGLPEKSGIKWIITDFMSGAILGRTENLSADQGGNTVACFTTPDGVKFAYLSLQYQRQPGTVRIEGKVAIHKMSLMVDSSAECSQKGT